MSPTVYTYYAPTELGAKPETLLRLWAESWKEYGWKPVVLGPHEAQQHKGFAAFDQKMRALPTVNPKEYEMACYHRWLAFEVVGGGLMVDFDVICNGLTPNGLDEATRRLKAQGMGSLIVLDRTRCPCAVFANSFGAADIVARLMRYRYDGRKHGERPHTSDMYIFQGNGDIPIVDLVKTVKYAEWKTSPLIHFSADACRATLGTRSKSDAITKATGRK